MPSRLTWEYSERLELMSFKALWDFFSSCQEIRPFVMRRIERKAMLIQEEWKISTMIERVIRPGTGPQ